jgi:sulfate adenylyltransferase subunit 2
LRTSSTGRRPEIELLRHENGGWRFTGTHLWATVRRPRNLAMRTDENVFTGALTNVAPEGNCLTDNMSDAVPRKGPFVTQTHADYQLSQLDQLEAESIHIFREVAAEFEKPVLLFSGGKDSIVMLRLAEKAFYPAKIPFPVMQVDTGLDFPEVLTTRDRWVDRLGVRLVVASVDEAIKNGVVVDDGKTSRNRLQIGTLLNAIESEGFTAAFGGGRRDEEKARAKERVYSHRDEFGQWDPKNQRPELWSLYNGRLHEGEHMRIFPISNWTELDIWDYIGREGIDIPQIYYAHSRRVIERDGMLLSESDVVQPRDGETVTERMVRFRTVGDRSLTGCVESTATTIEAIIEEVAASRVTERGATRGDDKFSEAAMEDRKKEGYF